MLLESVLLKGKEQNLLSVEDCIKYAKENHTMSKSDLDVVEREFKLLSTKCDLILDHSISYGLVCIEQYETYEAIKTLCSPFIREGSTKHKESVEILKKNIWEYNPEQFKAIMNGIGKGYKPNQIKLYISPYLNIDQISQIMDGIDKGLSVEQIKVYSWSEFDSLQMNQIKQGYLDGLQIPDVMSYARQFYSAERMEQKRLKLLNENPIPTKTSFFNKIKDNVGSTSFFK